MVANVSHLRFTPAEYLEWGAQQPLKYEYLNGEAYAMMGGSLAHNDVAINLTTALKLHLRGKGCKVQMSDAKVGVTENGPFFYPDVLVTCDPRDKIVTQLVQFPSLIVEVLSPTTEAYDRGANFAQYRRAIGFLYEDVVCPLML